MDPLTIVAAVVIGFLIFLATFVFVDLAALPGRIAERNGHSQAEAVRVAGIVGLLAGGLLWAPALAWAFVDFRDIARRRGGGDKDAELANRVVLLEARLALGEIKNEEDAS